MKRILPGFIFFFSSKVYAQSETPIEHTINEWVSPATDAISSVIFFSVSIQNIQVPIILLWLLSSALFFTLYLRFINFSGFKLAIDITRGVYDDPKDKGEVNHFQALTAALSGTLGLGNIAGVAVAISLGGPGATFWMIVAGLLGMTSKFAECTLGVKYRNVNPDGTVSGGPMYFLEKGFEKKGWARLGKILAITFSILCIGGSLGGGNMFQGNQATQQIIQISGGALAGYKFWIGVFIAALVGSVIIGGMKSIARVAEKLVPLMCGIYCTAALYVLVYNAPEIPSAFMKIMNGAFAPSAMYGGIVGVMLQGFKRASFSNEAGIGSASIAHAAVKTKEPVSEGIVALLEPFIDTVIVCTMTALVLVITGTYELKGVSGVELTSMAFKQSIHWFPYVLSVVVFLFAFATMISWCYYGLKSWTYIFGETKISDYAFKIIFCLAVILGASLNVSSVIDFSDAMIFAMSFPNMIGLYLMAPEIKADLSSFMKRIQSGEIKRHR